MDDNIKAFPSEYSKDELPNGMPVNNFNAGMDLRDYFASKALQATLSNSVTMQAITQLAKIDNVSVGDFVADTSYEYAVCMMKAREKIK